MTSMRQTNELATGGNVEYVHHIGTTVVDLQKSIEFWERFLGVPSRGGGSSMPPTSAKSWPIPAF